jgi:1-acyl-sn-glycerol-3-phosphate acyltransferase
VKAQLDYSWRLFATGMAFVVFGICGLLFSTLVFPPLCLWPYRASRQRAVTTIIHWFFRALIETLQRIGVMRLDLTGGAALRSSGPVIIVANHPTYLDVIVLLALTPAACCVVKRSHWRNPCLWGIVRAANYISNEDPLTVVDAGLRQLAAGYTVVIFPEGTRSPAPDRLHPFSRGFAHMALRTDRAILPVLMDCDPPAFTKQMRWYQVPSRPFCISVNVLEPVEAERFAVQSASPALAARSLTRAMETHFNERLADHGFFET